MESGSPSHASGRGVVSCTDSARAVVSSSSHAEDSGLVIPEATPHQQTGDTPAVVHFAASRPPEAPPLATPTPELTALGSRLPAEHNSKPGNYPTSKLLPSQMRMDVSAYRWKTLPSSHPYVTPTSASKQQRVCKSPIDGISRVANSAGTTPHRYSSSAGQSGVVGVVLRHDGLVCLPPLFTEELLQRKEMIKSRLQFKSSEWCMSWKLVTAGTRTPMKLTVFRYMGYRATGC